MIETHTAVDGVKTYRVRVGNGPRATFTKKSEAINYQAQQNIDRRRARAGLDVEKGAITFDGLCELFLASYHGKSKDWTTRMLKPSRAKWGKVYVRQLQPEAVALWLSKLTGNGGRELAPKTKHHILERMRAVCEMGVEWGYLSRSPVRPRAVKSPGQGRVREFRPFESWEEVESFASALAAEHPTWGPLVRFVCSTGLRPGEWQALTWNHVDTRLTEVNVPGTKTASSIRQVPLSDMAVAALEELPTPLRRTDHIFQTKRGKPLTGSNYHHWRKTHWRLAIVSAGITSRDPYEMRHTFATLALQAGVPLEIVSKLMGHTTIATTRKYYAKFTRGTLDLYRPLLNKIGETDGKDARASGG